MIQENDNAKKKDARYQVIAYQLAKRISQGELEEGTKLSGRSLLASQYEVSSETIRKAVGILQRYGVVEIHDRSGIIITSKEAANFFINIYITQKEDRKILSETVQIKRDLAQLESRLQHVLDQLVAATKSGFFPFDFFAFHLDDTMHFLGQDLKTTELKKHTQALLIGYEYDGIFSQNPDAEVVLKPGMTLYLLGGALIQAHVEKFFKEGEYERIED
jgi:DNA-binding transcriptional regulator YhcF (GntR family)